MENTVVTLVTKSKKDYLPLLLLGDEDEGMIDNYLERGDLFVLSGDDVKSLCVVTDEGGGVLEIQNLATYEQHQRKGYACQLLQHVEKHYAGRADKIILGTGDTPKILVFYEHRGFTVTHRVADFFTLNYKQPIIEDGVLLRDKVYLEKKLR